MTPLVLLAGVIAGLGVLLIGAGLIPARPNLEPAFTALRRPPTAATADPGKRRVRLLTAPLHRLGLPGARTRADLAVLERPIDKHLTDQMIAALTGLVLPPIAVGVFTAGGGSTSIQVPVWAAAAGGAAGWWLAETTVHTAANRRRDELRHALSAVLDLVVIALAAGAGLEQALDDACRDSRGWAAERLATAITTSRLLRIAPWQALSTLGDRTQVPELRELAAMMSLAGSEGARIRTSLTTRAATLRAHQAAALEARANSATERMSIPVMLLAAAYMLFLLYPAISTLNSF